MSKDNGTFEDWAKKGWAMVDGKLQKLVPLKEKVEKYPSLSVFDINASIPPAVNLERVVPKPNKIRNAVKSEENGVHFDSNLEKYMYGLLQGAGIDFNFQVKYILQEKFRYNQEAIRDVTLTVDFVIYNWGSDPSKQTIIDTKGHQTQQGAIRWKMFKKWLFDNWRTFDTNRVLPTIELPSTRKECDVLLNKILYDKPTPI